MVVFFISGVQSKRIIYPIPIIDKPILYIDFLSACLSRANLIIASLIAIVVKGYNNDVVVTIKSDIP